MFKPFTDIGKDHGPFMVPSDTDEYLLPHYLKAILVF